MIITIEAVPASGKTATADYLVGHHGGVRIAEVNEMFVRPDPESMVWYFQRQVDRWALALRSDREGRLVILDGDPFQPVWFNWIYPDRAELPWQEVLGFFQDRRDQVGLPRFHVYLFTSPEERFQREARRAQARGHDDTRLIETYRKYDAMLDPQKAFFNALGTAFPGFVQLCESKALPVTARSILAHAPPEPIDTSAVLAFMRDWLQSHSADQFRSSTQARP